jgi:hypothetical protein
MQISHHALMLRVCAPRDFTVPAESTTGQQIINVEKFGIGDARELVRLSHQRPGGSMDQQLLVVQTDFITHEAQNALLKVLEEPPQSTRFFFVIPLDFPVLPTLASRFQEVLGEVHSNEKGDSDLADFLSQTYADRIATIDARLKKSDTAWQRSIKRGLIDRLTNEKEYRNLPDVEYVTRTLLTRGASNKMLLEHVALILPVS